ncbi:hypothetical protein AB1286_33085 [Trinickia sp. NRRL B-1857]|uniref:hypothetical protein n=1 Tax=Trinickia sp. NRRL B-1857 TaxID=3162879 RepID=UPI003D2789F3
MTIDCPLRQALARIAPHLETLDPIDRESLRPAIRAIENDVEVIHVPDRLVARIRDIDGRLPK